MIEDERIQDEKFTEEELNNLYNMRYHNEEKEESHGRSR